MRGATAWALLFAALCACREEPAYEPSFSRAAPSSARALVFGVHPLHNPERLYADYDPILDRINARVKGFRLRLEASRSYAEFDRKLAERRFDFALPNPYQTLESLKHGYRIFGKMGDDASFRGVILTRRDSGIGSVAALKGKAVSFPAPTAVAATMMPLYYLHTHGLDARRDIRRVYAGSQESSMMSVFLGKTAAGATWPPPWEAFQRSEPVRARELVARWETAPLVNNGLVARDDVPKETVAAVARELFALERDEEGRRLLAALPLARFEPATEASYAPMKEFLRVYAKALGTPGAP